MVRRMDGAGGEVDEPRLLGVGGVDLVEPADGFVGHVGGEVIALLGRFRLRHRRGVAVEHRIVLVRFAVHEAVEVFKAPGPAGGPAIEGTGGADFGVRRVVPLAERGGGIAVLAEDFRQGGGGVRDDAGVAGKAGAHLDDDAGADAVVVASGEQGGAGR